MANEAVPIELPNGGRIIRLTVADGTGIEKGTILQLTDPRTASASSADGQFFAGIAAEEKVANDGQTSIGVWTQGIFDLKDSGVGFAAGEPVKIAGANLVALADDDTMENHGEVVGLALETAAASEVVAVAIGLYSV